MIQVATRTFCSCQSALTALEATLAAAPGQMAAAAQKVMASPAKVTLGVSPGKLGASPGKLGASPAVQGLRVRGPTLLERVRKPVMELSVGPESGWREPDVVRQAELEECFRNHQWGMSVFRGVSLVGTNGTIKQDSEGLFIINDGLQTVTVLQKLYNEYLAGDEALLDPNLLRIFTEGLEVEVLEYSEDDRDLRELWCGGIHDEENNRYMPTSIAKKVSIVHKFRQKVPGGDWEATSKLLIDAYGPSKRSTVGRWIRAAKALEKGALDVLNTRPRLPPMLIFDNPWFTSATPSQRLTEGSQIKALQLLFEEMDNESTMTRKSFEHLCKSLKAGAHPRCTAIPIETLTPHSSSQLDSEALRLRLFGI